MKVYQDRLTRDLITAMHWNGRNVLDFFDWLNPGCTVIEANTRALVLSFGRRWSAHTIYVPYNFYVWKEQKGPPQVMAWQIFEAKYIIPFRRLEAEYAALMIDAQKTRKHIPPSR